jgi:ATP-dependent Clp protease protease subunit
MDDFAGSGVFDRLLRERIVWLGEQVNDKSANRICAELMLLSAESKTQDILLYINSPGGSITAGMAIYDVMQYIEPDITTVGIGLAASMGQFLLSSGAKGKRYAMTHTRVLMHQPSGGIGGTATDIRINTELLLHMKQTMAELTAHQTGKTVEQIHRDADRDHWFTAEEAREYGFVDHVISSVRSITRQSPKVQGAKSQSTKPKTTRTRKGN